MANTVTPSPGNAVMCHGPSRGRQNDKRPGARIFHQGSSCFTALSIEAEYMAATVLPSVTPRAPIASGLGPYMTREAAEIFESFREPVKDLALPARFADFKRR